MRKPVARAIQVCPVEVASAVLGGAWKLTIVKHLIDGPHRFGALSRLVPLANRTTLTRQLKELELDGIVERRDFSESPRRVEYSLTTLGTEVAPLVAAMNRWGADYVATVGAARMGAADSSRT